MNNLPEKINTAIQSNRAVGMRVHLGEECDGDMESITRALIAIILGLSEERRSPDMMYLAMHRAKDLSKTLGLDEEEFAKAASVCLTYWYGRHSNDPFSRGMFGFDKL